MPRLVEEISTDGQTGGACDTFRMFVLDEAARQKELGGRDVIRLTLGKSDLPLHADIREAIVSAVRDPGKSNLVFPEGLPELREALAAHYTELARSPVPITRILIDAGTSSLYPSLFRLLVGGGDEVLIPSPYYPLYRVSALLAGARVRHYHVCLDTMRLDMHSLAENLTQKTRIIVINSPGNPLGNIITRSELSQILDLLPEQAFLVFDEIYENVIFGAGQRLAPLLLAGNTQYGRQTIVTNSCSKGYRMYSKRVGWCVLPEALADAFRPILHHTRLTVDPAVQYGAVEALRRPKEVEALLAVHRERWSYVRDHLSEIPGLRLLLSQGGFFCTLDCREFIKLRKLGDCSGLALDVLDKAGIATVPGVDFGLPGMLRLALTASRFEEAINRLAEYFTGGK